MTLAKPDGSPNIGGIPEVGVVEPGQDAGARQARARRHGGGEARRPGGHACVCRAPLTGTASHAHAGGSAHKQLHDLRGGVESVGSDREPGDAPSRVMVLHLRAISASVPMSTNGLDRMSSALTPGIRAASRAAAEPASGVISTYCTNASISGATSRSRAPRWIAPSEESIWSSHHRTSCVCPSVPVRPKPAIPTMSAVAPANSSSRWLLPPMSNGIRPCTGRGVASLPRSARRCHRRT